MTEHSNNDSFDANDKNAKHEPESGSSSSRSTSSSPSSSALSHSMATYTTASPKNSNGKRPHQSPQRRDSVLAFNEETAVVESASQRIDKRNASLRRSQVYMVGPKSSPGTSEENGIASQVSPSQLSSSSYPTSASFLSQTQSGSYSTSASSQSSSYPSTPSATDVQTSFKWNADPSYGVSIAPTSSLQTSLTNDTAAEQISTSMDDDSSQSKALTPTSSKRFSRMSEEERHKYAAEIDAQEKHPTQDEEQVGGYANPDQNPNLNPDQTPVAHPQSSTEKPNLTTTTATSPSLRHSLKETLRHPFKHRLLSAARRSYIFNSNPPNTRALRKRFPSNEIRTTKYRWYSFFILNLLEQFREYSNIYFVFIMILSLLPGLSPVGPITAILPVVFILSANMFREGVQDILRWREDKKSNFERCTVLRGGRWQSMPKKDLRVGEIVKVERNQDVPADIIVLSSTNAEGMCFIETSNLDGETTMKIKNARPETNTITTEQQLSSLHLQIACQPPNKQFDFSGTMSMDGKGEHTDALMYEHFVPRSSTLLNTDHIVGLVTYTGKNTKMFLNLKKTKTKFSIMQKTLNKIFFGIIVLNQFFAAMIVLGSLLFHEYTTRTSWYLLTNDAPSFGMAFSNYLTALILLNLMIPMSLYVSLEFVKMIQARFMTWDDKMKHKGSPLAVYSNNLNSDLAKIEIIFSDKTGTLTENKMRFKYSSIDMIRFDEGKQRGSLQKYAQKDECDDEMREKIRKLLFCLSVCHTIIPHELKEGEEEEKGSEVSEDEEQLEIELEDQNLNDTLTLGDEQETDVNVTPARWSQREWPTSPDYVEEDEPVTPQMSRINGNRTPPYGDTPSNTDFTSPNGDISPDPHQTPNPHATTTAPRIRFDGESPDEIALINFAKDNGYILKKRSQESITVEINGQESHFKILALMPFSSRRKRMSVVIREPTTNEIIVFTKGADSEMMGCLEQNRDNALHRNKATELLTSFSKEGLRTLVMSYKIITQEEFDTWHQDWHAAENALDDRNLRMDDTAITLESHGYTLLGTTAIEDCLQEMVPETLRFFREAGVQIWMLTGDKMETAINIGRSSEMISTEAQQFILNAPLPPNFDVTEVSNEIEHQLDRIIEYKKPYFIALQGKLLDICLLKNKNLERKFVESVRFAETVICCRSTPDQKAMLVKLGRKRLKKLGLAVGDGANDVSMIQQARVGVGIRGREGSQASRASDFSIARFYLMKRLLAVHGHWSYYRSAKFVQYSFYKNMLVTFYQILFTIFNGYTMQTLIDSWVLTFYNVIFTLLIPFVFGIFEKDIPDHILEQDPRIYTATLKERIFSSEASFAWIFRAFLHSSIVFFVVMFYTANTGLDDLWTQAALLSLTANWVIVLKAFLEMKYHTVIHYFSLWFSVVSLHVFYVVYSAFPDIPTTGGIAYYITYTIHTNFAFYLVLPLVVALCMIPEIAWKLIINMVRPRVRTKLKTEHVRLQKKEMRRNSKKSASRLRHSATDGARASVGANLSAPRRRPSVERRNTMRAVDEAFGVTGVSNNFSPVQPPEDDVQSGSSADEVNRLGRDTPYTLRDPALISISPHSSRADLREDLAVPPHSPFFLEMPTIGGDVRVGWLQDVGKDDSGEVAENVEEKVGSSVAEK